MDIDFTFATVTLAIAKLFILMFTGFLLRHWNFIDDEFTETMSLLLVRIIFPALIITKTIAHFSFHEFPNWWFFPLMAMLFSAFGLLLGRIIYPFLGSFTSKREFISSCGFYNCGYLPMNLILFSFTGLLADRLLVFMFLYIIGFNLLMWSFGPIYLSGKLTRELKMRIFLNPPVLATLFSLLWVALLGQGSLPGVIADPLSQLGQASFPLAMIILGSFLYRYKAFAPTSKIPVIASLVTKLFIFPAIVLGAIYFAPLSMDYKFFLFLEAIMPAAVSLVIIGSYTSSDNELFSSVVFYTHLVAIFSIPVWLMVFRMVVRG